MEESIIIEKIKSGDSAAFSSLYERYWQKVYGFTQLYINSPIEVSDVVQDVFVKVWENRAQLDSNQNLDGFLFICTRNLIFQHTRKHFNEIRFKETIARAIEYSDDMEDELVASDLKDYIDRLIVVLPPKRQQIFRMSREKYMTNKQIAEICEVSEKNVERHITLALKFIKENLPLFILFVGGYSIFK